MTNLKRVLFESALLQGTVMLTVITVPGLKLPEFFRCDGTCLEYGDNMPSPIPDMEITDEGVSATLPFGQASHKTFVPWSAVVRMRQEGRFVCLWPIEIEAETIAGAKLQVVA